ncbi:biotin/lipoyl-containing protein [Amphritea sp. HPY]|uniref:biotin/lipoyl-containing protein n=1 Tax=Amphritea sp. HPY TaxID=3421652 RepID=UPI003D7E3C41
MSANVELQTSGNMWKVLVKEGDTVAEGDDLFIMEVMKMEVPHQAPISGTITEVHVCEGEEGLDAGMVAVVIE